MRPPRRSAALFCVLACAATFPVTAPVHVDAAGPPTVGPCPTLPADNVWNTDVSALPVNSHSAAWIASSGGTGQLLHPDWGPSGGSVPYGIPWQLVDASHQKVPVSFQYAAESDPGPYPLGPDTPIEGGAGSGGDRHALVVDTGTCTLYETWDTQYSASGSTAGSGAVFPLTSNALRPAGWTSADAAGLPILPGLVRYTEVQSGALRHAIRFTVQRTDKSYLWPARHQAGSAFDASLPPMGARFRMKSGVDISHFSAPAQVILTAMKHYGLILADNGSNWYFQGDTDPGWSNGVLSELKTIPAGDFEAVDESSLMVDANSGQARQGVTATPTPIVLKPASPRVTPPAAATPATAPAPLASPTEAATLPPTPAATPSPLIADATQVTPEASPAEGGEGVPVAAVPAGSSGGVGVPVAAVAGGGAGAVLLLGGGGALVLRRRRRVV